MNGETQAGIQTRIQKNLEKWDQLFSGRPWGRYPPEELVRFVARNFGTVPARENVRILELGSGPGANIWYLAREGYSVAGIDGSATAIRLTEERLKDENLPTGAAKVDLTVGNYAQLPWPDDHFDAVIDVASLCQNYMSTIRKAVDESYRTLRPGGLLFSKSVGVKTTGSSSGERLEENTTADPLDGPFAGLGITHFFTENEIYKVFNRFSEITLDWLHRSDNGMRSELFEWLIVAKK
jgi:SAM-dependent methyltransferase